MIKKPNLKNFRDSDRLNLEKALVACRAIHTTQEGIHASITEIIKQKNSGSYVDPNRVWMQILQLSKIFDAVKDNHNISLLCLIDYISCFIGSDGQLECAVLVKNQTTGKMEKLTQKIEQYQAIKYGTLEGLLDMCIGYKDKGISNDKKKRFNNIENDVNNTINMLQKILKSCNKASENDMVALMITKDILKMWKNIPHCIQEDLFNLVYIRNKALQHFDSDYLYENYMKNRKEFDIQDNVNFNSMTIVISANDLFSCLSGVLMFCDLAQQLQRIINYMLVQVYQTYVKTLNYEDIRLNYTLRQVQVDDVVQKVNIFHTGEMYYLADISQDFDWKNSIRML